MYDVNPLANRLYRAELDRSAFETQLQPQGGRKRHATRLRSLAANLPPIVAVAVFVFAAVFAEM